MVKEFRRHDISGFTKLLLEAYIGVSTIRMAALIDGVLIYSRVDAGSDRATANLSHAIEESLTVVTHDPSTACLRMKCNQ
jgi:hypothetical protein